MPSALNKRSAYLSFTAAAFTWVVGWAESWAYHSATRRQGEAVAALGGSEVAEVLLHQVVEAIVVRAQP